MDRRGGQPRRIRDSRARVCNSGIRHSERPDLAGFETRNIPILSVRKYGRTVEMALNSVPVQSGDRLFSPLFTVLDPGHSDFIGLWKSCRPLAQNHQRPCSNTVGSLVCSSPGKSCTWTCAEIMGNSNRHSRNILRHARRMAGARTDGPKPSRGSAMAS